MKPHRPAYDAYADPRASEQRHAEMSDTLDAHSSDARLARMQQASGLPQGHTHTPPGLDSHAQAHRFRAQSPQPRHAQPHEYSSAPPPSVRMPSEAARLDAPRNHAADRHYDDYYSNSNHPRSHAQYSEHHRSPRYPASPLHAASPSYDYPSEARYRQQPYNDYPFPRATNGTSFHDQPHPHHASSTYPNVRRDDVERSPAQHMRQGLPSPRDLVTSAHRISPAQEFANRNPNSFDAAHRSAYPPASFNHDGRHMPDVRHDAAAAASHPPTSSSANAARSTHAPRKRKKQFKYLLECDGDDATHSHSSAANEDQLDADHYDNSAAVDAADGGASPRKESRKKVKKACVFCKRSHMPCEEARPCKRCVKRGISHLCRDAEPVGSAGAAANGSAKAAKLGEARHHARARRGKQKAASDHHVGETESESDLDSLASSAASCLPHARGARSVFGAALAAHTRRYDMNVIPGAGVRDPDCRPAMPVSMLVSPSSAELARGPQRRPLGVSEKEQEEAWNRSMNPHMQHKMKQMLEAGPASSDLSDIFGEMPTSLLMTPAMANLPQGQSLLPPASTEPHSSPERSHRAETHGRSLSESLPPTTDCQVDEAGFKLPPRPRHLLQEEMATTSELRGAPPRYSYTYGYAKLARWMHTRYSRESCEQVDRSLSVIRPKLMALSRSLPEEELIGVEESFYRLIEFYQTNVLETIPIPIIVARRTGEIYAANSHACKLFQLPASLFEGGQICHYQLVTERDCVSMWDKYAAEAEGKLDTPPNQQVMLEVDRSLLLFDKPGFDPRTGELLGDARCPDGGPVVVRQRVVITFEAKISKHGLPFMVTGCIVPIPDDETEASHKPSSLRPT